MPNQNKDIAVPGLVKFGAKDPGTIITTNVGEILKSNRTKIIKKIEIDSIRYNHPNLFEQNEVIRNYLTNKNKVYQDILQQYFRLEKNPDSKFLKELRTNFYNFILLNTEERDLIKEYNNFYKDKEI